MTTLTFTCLLLFTRDIGSDKDIWAADIGGNQRVNAIFEATLHTNDNIKPTQNCTSVERQKFIKDKYVHHKYLDVSNYSLCRASRTQSVIFDEDSSAASDIFSSFMTPSPSSTSMSNRQSHRSIATPPIVTQSLFFTPSIPEIDDDVDDEEDMFADSATTTSELFGHARSSSIRRPSSFDGEVIEEGNDEDDDSDQDGEASELPYPKLAQSVSNFSAFTFSSTVPSKMNVPHRPSSSPLHSTSDVNMDILKQQKKEALENEDYMRAAQIKRQMAALLKPSSTAEIESLESLKKLAVRQEDYIRAAELKTRIEELRNRSQSSSRLQAESPFPSPAVSTRKYGQSPRHRDSLESYFGRAESEEDQTMQDAIEKGRFQADEDDDIDDESQQVKKNDLGQHLDSQREDASQRFSRSINETSQHSRLDNLGFVVNDDAAKKESNDFQKAPLTHTDSSSSRRMRRTPVRDPTRDGSGGKKSRSRSRTRREKLRRSSNTNEKRGEKAKIQTRDRRVKDEQQRRNRSSSRDKKVEKSSHQQYPSKSRDRSKSRERQGSSSKDRQNRDRSKSRDKKSHHNEKQDRDRSKSRERSKSRDRKSQHKEKQSRDRSKSRDRKTNQKKNRDRSKSNERRREQEKATRNRSKSRERKSTTNNGRSGRESQTVSESRSRSKSRTRRDPRRKSGANKLPDSQAFVRSTSFSQPAIGASFSSPLVSKTKQFSTSMPACSLSMFSPVAQKGNGESLRRKTTEGIDQPIHHSPKLEEDTSIDESFLTFSSDNVQSAHQRSSAGRVSMSRRNLGSDSQNICCEVSPKGSQSLHYNRRSLTESFDFNAFQTERLFAPKPSIGSPSMSTISGGIKRSSAGYQTPRSKPFSKRQLKIGSPAGVEDFPGVAATPEAPTRKISLTEKYKQEVERTVARLERLREMKRNQEGIAPQSPATRAVST